VADGFCAFFGADRRVYGLGGGGDGFLFGIRPGNHPPPHLFELLLALPIMVLMAGVHGVPYAAIAGLVVIPLLPFLRRGKVLDALIVAILAGIAAYFVANIGDDSFPGMAEFHYLSPRIAASFAAAGACIYLLGRGDDRRFAAAISTSTTRPRRRGAAYWRKADRG